MLDTSARLVATGKYSRYNELLRVTKNSISYGNNEIALEDLEAITMSHSSLHINALNVNYSFESELLSVHGKILKIRLTGSGYDKQAPAIYAKVCALLELNIVPVIVSKKLNKILSGETVLIGNIKLRKDGLIMSRRGFLKKTHGHLVDWSHIETKPSNGELLVYSSEDYRIQASLDVGSIANACIFPSILTNMKKRT